MTCTKTKILVVCSRNRRRSLTAETLFRGHPRLEVRSAGTSPSARHQVSTKDIEWADIIWCMESKHREMLLKLFGEKVRPKVRVADIKDTYRYMDPELCEMFKGEILRNNF